jgi:hypothetical protein
MRITHANDVEMSRPFLIQQLVKIDETAYSEALLESRLLAESYDPELQTSRYPVYAGSHLTYSDTFSGLGSRDDTRQSDT